MQGARVHRVNNSNNPGIPKRAHTQHSSSGSLHALPVGVTYSTSTTCDRTQRRGVGHWGPSLVQELLENYAEAICDQYTQKAPPLD